MHNFDGRSSTRSVSMRGSSRHQETSQSILIRMKQERAQRARTRLENSSARSLQAAARTYLELEHHLEAWRILYDRNEIPNLPALLFIVSRGRVQQLPLERHCPVDFTVDLPRTLRAANFILDHSLSPNAWLPSHVAGLMALFLRTAAAISPADHFAAAQSLVLAAERMLTVAEDSAEATLGMFENLLRFYNPCEDVGTLLTYEATSSIGASVAMRIVRLGMRSSVEVMQQICTLFVKSILTVENVVEKLSLSTHEVYLVLNSLKSVKQWNEMFQGKVEILLANVVDLTKGVWTGGLNDNLWAALRVVTGLLAALDKDSGSSHESMDIDDDEETEDDQTKSAKVTRVLERLGPLLKEKTAISLITTAASEEGTESLEFLSKLFLMLTANRRQLHQFLLNALAFSQPNKLSVLPVLWRACLVKRTKNGVAVTPDTVDASYPNILSLFSRAFAHKLYLQDESESIVVDSSPLMHLDQKNDAYFTRDELVLMCKILKDGLCAAYLQGVHNTTKAAQSTAVVLTSLPGLLDAVSRLLSRLHFLDENKPFTPGATFWTFGNVFLTSEDFNLDAVSVFSENIQRPHMRSSQRAVADILYKAPYLVPFSTRAKIFYSLVEEERSPTHPNTFELRSSQSRWITIRRSHLFEDALEQLWDRGDELKSRIRVKFVDRLGTEEVGIDGGGVYKEFMNELLKKCFSPTGYGLFTTNEDNELYPNRTYAIGDPDGYKRQYRFLGQMLGKAVFDGVVVDIPLASFFLKKMLNNETCFGDLKSMDNFLYRSLSSLKALSSEEIDSLGLDFTLTENDFGQVREVELVRGGRSRTVRKRDIIEYVHRVAHYRMNRSIKHICEQFLMGFREIVKLEWARLFSERELQLLISGKKGSIDIEDLKKCTKYSGGYTEDTVVIKWFWSMVDELDDEKKGKLLKFVTSSERAPLLGFSYLHPKFSIHRADGDTRLPTASTCMNLLKLPEYKSRKAMEEKLMYALDSNAGFDLS